MGLELKIPATGMVDVAVEREDGSIRTMLELCVPAPYLSGRD